MFTTSWRLAGLGLEMSKRLWDVSGGVLLSWGES